MKIRKSLALFLAVAIAVPTIPAAQVYAEEADISTEIIEEDSQENGGYKLVWEDNFDGDELNREYWNVEEHEKGWVNKEWQEYVDNDEVIQLSNDENGILKINAIKENADSESVNVVEGFEISQEVTEANMGANPWDIQPGRDVSLENGKTYLVEFTASSSVERKIGWGVQDKSSYGPVAEGTQRAITITSTPRKFTKEITMTSDCEKALFYFNLGKADSGDTPESTVNITDISFKEVTPSLTKNGDFSRADGGTGFAAEWQMNNESASNTITMGEDCVIATINEANDLYADYKTQLFQPISVEGGKKYIVSFTAESSVSRTIAPAIQKNYGDYGSYGDAYPYLNADEPKNIMFEVDMTGKDDDSNVSFRINLGQSDFTETHTIKISNAYVSEVPQAEVYTSGRISTQNKVTFTYGRFEARAKVPAGQGFLPAFWLMSNDENVYGVWPQCGEIDCMEVMGQNPNKVYGTIHYGLPHQESQGTYVTGGEETNFSEDFHTFTCDWEPGKITWYVDGIKYHEAQNWYSKAEDGDALTYPAPFDQPFYIILNLAVGGSWVGNPDETTVYENNPFEIDYVKVYQKESYDDSNVVKPDVEFKPDVNHIDGDGNIIYVLNGDFANAEEKIIFGEGEEESGWVFKTALGGEATAGLAAAESASLAGKNEIKVDITAEGTEDYSVQLYQAGIPVEKGATYKVKYTAYADAECTMNVDLKAPDHGYAKYMPTHNPSLTTEPQEFTTEEFKMKSDSDANGRIEFNMGKYGTHTIHITDVSIVKTADADPDEVEPKVVQPDGNYLYNGSFDKGDKHLGDWEFALNGTALTDDDEDAAITAISKLIKEGIKVTPFDDGRRLSIPANKKLTLTQKDLAFDLGTGTPYKFSMQIDSNTGKETVSVTIGGNQYDILVNKIGKKTYSFAIPEDKKLTDKNIAINISSKSEIIIDNIKFENNEVSLIKNGKFNSSSIAPFTTFRNDPAAFTAKVENDELKVTIGNTGNDSWHIQLIQYAKLEKGKSYKLTYNAKTDLPGGRKIWAQIQHDPDKHSGQGGYENYPNTGAVEIGSEYQATPFETEFTMTYDTDEYAKFNVCLGAIDGSSITDEHNVYLDDISLVEVVNENAGKIIVEDIADQAYTGKALTPDVVVKVGDRVLTKGTDYKLTYKNNVNVNKEGTVASKLPSVTITGLGSFEKIITKNFNIVEAEIDAVAEIVTSDYLAENTKGDTTVKFSVNKNADGKALSAKSDYTSELSAVSVKNADGEDVADGTVFAGNKIPKGYTGDFSLKVTGKGNYKNDLTVAIHIEKNKTPIAGAKITINTIPATGENITETEIEAAIKSIVVAGKELTLGTDCHVASFEKKDAGKYKAILVADGESYNGTKIFDVVIKGTAMSKTKIEFNANTVFDGSAKGKNGLKITLNGTELIENTDYVVTDENIVNDTNVGTAKVTVKGIGKFEGTVTKTYKINPLTFVYGTEDSDNVTVAVANQKYVAKNVAITPDPEVKVGATTLVKDKDYKLTYTKNKEIGTATLTITGKGNYKGVIKNVPFAITAGDAANIVVTANDVVAPTKANKFQTVPVLTVDGKKLAVGTDYDRNFTFKRVFRNVRGEIASSRALTATDIPPVGAEIEVTVKCTNMYEGEPELKAYYRIVAADISKATIKINNQICDGTGNGIELTEDDIYSASIKVGSETRKLTLGKDYVIVSYANNNKAGKASVTVKGIGQYGGTKTLAFQIAKKAFK